MTCQDFNFFNLFPQHCFSRLLSSIFSYPFIHSPTKCLHPSSTIKMIPLIQHRGKAAFIPAPPLLLLLILSITQGTHLSSTSSLLLNRKSEHDSSLQRILASPKVNRDTQSHYNTNSELHALALSLYAQYPTVCISLSHRHHHSSSLSSFSFLLLLINIII